MLYPFHETLHPGCYFFYAIDYMESKNSEFKSKKVIFDL